MTVTGYSEDELVEQPAPHQDSGRDGAESLPRVVCQVPFPWA